MYTECRGFGYKEEELKHLKNKAAELEITLPLPYREIGQSTISDYERGIDLTPWYNVNWGNATIIDGTPGTFKPETYTGFNPMAKGRITVVKKSMTDVYIFVYIC